MVILKVNPTLAAFTDLSFPLLSSIDGNFRAEVLDLFS
jgi:hypothetical protein